MLLSKLNKKNKKKKKRYVEKKRKIIINKKKLLKINHRILHIISLFYIFNNIFLSLFAFF